jgi:hypothetical protein
VACSSRIGVDVASGPGNGMASNEDGRLPTMPAVVISLIDEAVCEAVAAFFANSAKDRSECDLQCFFIKMFTFSYLYRFRLCPLFCFRGENGCITNALIVATHSSNDVSSATFGQSSEKPFKFSKVWTGGG